jgi:hypothetical protein
MNTTNPVKLNAISSGDFLKNPTKALASDPSSPKALEEYVAAHKFDINKKPPEDVAVLLYKDLQIGSRGNIVTITGKAKSRKTVIASAIATSFFLPAEAEFLGFNAALNPDDKILHIDTEQGYYHYYESVVRIFRDAGVDIPERFTSIHTRDAEVGLRIELTEYLLETLRPRVCIVDGVTDFVYDINSQQEAVEVGEKLLQWSYRYDCVIIVVIHTTKTTGYMTGAIGTYLEKKCETSIKVEKPEDNEDISTVTCQFSRNKSFPSFVIEYDPNKNRYIVIDDQAITTKGAKGKKSPEAYPPETHKAMITRMFLFREAFKDFELRGSIVSALKHVSGDTIKANQATAWMHYYNEAGLIFCNPEGAWMRVGPAATSPDPTTKQANLNFNSPDETATSPEIGTDDLPF